MPRLDSNKRHGAKIRRLVAKSSLLSLDLISRHTMIEKVMQLGSHAIAQLAGREEEATLEHAIPHGPDDIGRMVLPESQEVFGRWPEPSSTKFKSQAFRTQKL